MMLTMRFLLLLMLSLAACWASIPLDEDVSPQVIHDVSDDYRLSTENVVPIEYNIKLEPTFESNDTNKMFTFKGTSVITLNITKSTNTITFHAKELDFIEKEIKLTYNNKGENANLTKISKETRKDFVTLTFEKAVEPVPNAKLTLQYSGKLNSELRGFFKSSYQNKDGKETWLAATHFEPVSARKAFPCWDEPQLKAQFSITIVVPDTKYKAISNTPGSEKNKETTFKKTPIMSPYLVAFAVSDFTALTNEKKTFNVWANPTVEKNEKEFAFNFGWKALEALKNFTNIDYYGPEQNMKKMDQIAIPGFRGAMENWGLVTYRENGFLYKVNKTTTETKQSIATVIAHEFTHQWFGNLVTCEWWNYIWLNEGFATFFQYYIADKVIPKLDEKEKWRLMEQFVIKNVQASALVVDASSKTRALNPKNNIQTPAQISSLFDDIAYKKGASILHMMYGLLSEDIFQKGLKQYLNTYKGKSVNSDNFFDSVQESNDKKLKEEYLPKGKSLKEVMKNWVNEPGYPVITVTWNKTLPGVVNITQERYFSIKPTKKDETQWYIPLSYVTEESPNQVLPKDKKSGWMVPGTFKLFDKLNNTKWILFNKDQTGYYRVNYDEANWNLLTAFLTTSFYGNISAINRAQLIDDALNLARSKHLAYKTALTVTSYLSSETDYIPWYAAVRAFNFLDTVLQGGKNYTEYQKYVVSKIENFAKKVAYKDWKNGTHVDKLGKVLALNTACKYNMADCTQFASKKLKEWLDKKDNEDDKNIWIDVRKDLLCAGMQNDAQTWNKTLQKYKTTKDADEKRDLLAALGCIKSKETIQKFLALSLEKDPHVDIFAAMNSVLAGYADSFNILVEFINNNIEIIQKADYENNSLLVAVVNNLAHKVITIEQYAELSLLIHRHLQDLQMVEGLTVAVNKLDWIKTNREGVEKWIVDNCDACKKPKPKKGKPDTASSIALTSFLLISTLLITRFY